MAKLKDTLGFTMIDLLVATIIIVVLFSYVLANFRSSDRYKDLERVSAGVLSELRGVQIMSKAGQLVGICSGDPSILCFDDSQCVLPESCLITSPPGGYGVLVSACLPNTCSYQTVAFDDSQQLISDQPFPNNVLRQFELPGENFFDSVYFSDQEPVNGICPPPSLVSSITDFQVRFPTSAQAATLQFDLIPTPVPAVTPRSVVAIIENNKTNQQRCIFFSRASGLIGEYKIN